MNCKRKLTAWLLVCVMIFSLIPVSVFAAEEAHEHDFAEITKILREATCEVTGIAKYSCECGEYKYAQIPPHAVRVDVVTKEETCGVAGTKNIVCEACGEVLEEDVEIPATGKHVQVEDFIEASCGKNAQAGPICKICRTPLGEMKEVPGTALEHDYKPSTAEEDGYVAATCTEGGKDAFKCAREGCGDTYTVDTEALGHTEGEPVYTAPNCTNPGRAVTSCTVCKVVIKDEELVEADPALGHKKEEIPAVAPTCTETGLTAGEKCSDCGEILVAQEEIPALGHTEAEAVIVENQKAPTCAADGSYDEVLYCTVCNEELNRITVTVPMEPDAHDHQLATTLKAATCTTNGIGKYACVYCGDYEYRVIESGHKLDDGVVTAEPTCEEAGNKLFSCTVEGCGYTEDREIEALGHTAAEAVEENVVAATCGKDGSYEEVIYCSVCGDELSREAKVIEATGKHTPVEDVIEATCEENAFVGIICSECGTALEELTEVPGTALGHDWQADNTVEGYKEATCTEAGVNTFKCANSNCGETKTEDVEALGHTDGEEEYFDPTCDEAGKVIVKCAICKEPIETRYIKEEPALGHKKEEIPAVEATCQAAGLTAGVKCSVCGEILTAQEEVAKLEHTPADAVREKEVAPTCNADGSYDEVVYCSVCNEELNRITVVVPMEPDAHDYQLATTLKAATCTTNGIGKYACVYCEDYEYRVIEGSHKLDDGVVTAEPTCEEAGNKLFSCTVEGCGYTENREIEALGHTAAEAVEENVVAATCGKDGSYDEVIYCSVCGDELSREAKVIEATGKHTPVEDVIEATCEENAFVGIICSECGTALGELTEVPETALGHDWQADNTVEGYKEATCTEAGVNTFKCANSNCGETKTEDVEALGHTDGEEEYIDPTCDEAGKVIVKCANCDEPIETRYIEEEPALGHKEEEIPAVAPTCTETGLTAGEKCSVCGDILVAQEEIPALGHTEAEAVIVENQKAPTCAADGSYDEVLYCTVCNEELNRITVTVPMEPDAHDYQLATTLKEATCTTNGIGKYVCSVEGCGAYEYRSIKSSHDYDDGAVTLEPTCDEVGTLTYTCKICGDTEEEEIDALGHVWGTEEKVNDDSTAIYCECTVCGAPLIIETFPGFDPDAPLHTHEYEAVVTEPTCTEEGYTTYTCVCGDTYIDDEVEALGHTEVIDEAVDATCTETGLTEGSHCSVCNEILVAQTEVPALGHTEVVDEAIAATCTEPGLIAGIHCSVCNEVLSAQTEIPALGHTEVVDEAVAATCTETGLTAGAHCSVCEATLVEQEIVEALGHTEVIDEAVAATCTETGLTEGSHCSVCEKTLIEQEIVEALGHTEVIDEAVAATCTETGLTEGSHCSVCEATLEAQEKVPALGHTEVIDEAKAATCTETGLTAGKHCSVCEATLEAQEEVPALGHTEVIDEAKAATCTATGLTVGAHCSVCEETLVAQEIVPALGHTEVVDEAKAATCTETGLSVGAHCSVCGDTLVAQVVIPAIGHAYVETEAYDDETGELVVIHTCSKCGDSY